MINKYILYLTVFFVPHICCGQYSQLLNKDTAEIIRSKAFNFIESNLDSLKTGNFETLKSRNDSIIFYGTTPDSSEQKLFLYLTKEDRPFIWYMNKQNVDSSFKKWKNTKRSLYFLQPEIKNTKSRLNLDIYPLVKFKDKIFFKISALSPGFNDDMYGTELYFTFDSDLELISIKISDFSM